jgi:hypothetical protein
MMHSSTVEEQHRERILRLIIRAAALPCSRLTCSWSGELTQASVSLPQYRSASTPTQHGVRRQVEEVQLLTKLGSLKNARQRNEKTLRIKEPKRISLG